MSPEYFRDQARRCRRLADEIADEKAKKTLLELAVEYEKRVIAEAAAEKPNSARCDAGAAS